MSHTVCPPNKTFIIHESNILRWLIFKDKIFVNTYLSKFHNNKSFLALSIHRSARGWERGSYYVWKMIEEKWIMLVMQEKKFEMVTGLSTFKNVNRVMKKKLPTFIL